MSDDRPTSPFNVVTGVPRSCTTLMQNLLNQNPDFYCSSTSHLARESTEDVTRWISTPDFQAALGRDRQGETSKLYERAKKLFDDRHQADAEAAGKPDAVVFDKGRGWTFALDLLWSVYPNARVIVCVRDLRDVFASMERQFRKNGLLNNSPNLISRTITARMASLFSLDGNGHLGGPIAGVSDMINRGLFRDGRPTDDRIILVRAEDLARAPRANMKAIYKRLNVPYYKPHQFDDVENTATDPDHTSLYHFPHEGCGKVEASPHKWSASFAQHIGDEIIQRYPRYFMQFGYWTPTPVQEQGER